jgi:hypothetical protein
MMVNWGAPDAERLDFGDQLIRLARDHQLHNRVAVVAGASWRLLRRQLGDFFADSTHKFVFPCEMVTTIQKRITIWIQKVLEHCLFHSIDLLGK